MKEIQLNKLKRTENFMKYKVLVDDEDFEKINRYDWMIQTRKNKSLLYAGRMVGKNMVLLHRFIMEVGKEHCIDHIDGNGLNCQKVNLRIVTVAQNNMNRIGNKNSSSVFKGVSFHKKRNKWDVSISYNGKRYYLGAYNNEVDAAVIYNKAAKKFFGEYARLNKIPSKHEESQ